MWYQRAAEQALDASDPSGTIQCAERAIASGAQGEVLGALEGVCAEARYCRGEIVQAKEVAKEAASHLPEGSETWLHAVAALISAAGQAGE